MKNIEEEGMPLGLDREEDGKRQEDWEIDNVGENVIRREKLREKIFM